MPQLDMTHFFYVTNVLAFFIVGMHIFCAYVVPYSLVALKLNSSRIYYYYISVLFLSTADLGCSHFTHCYHLATSVTRDYTTLLVSLATSRVSTLPNHVKPFYL